MADRRKTITLGVAVAVAVLAAVVSAAWIAVLLFVLAAFLIAWALDPKRTEAFVGRLPFGNYILRALAKLDSMLSGRRS
jgi:Flp pilus assembly protein TadB